MRYLGLPGMSFRVGERGLAPGSCGRDGHDAGALALGVYRSPLRQVYVVHIPARFCLRVFVVMELLRGGLWSSWADLLVKWLEFTSRV